jgi:hypothetical protein
MRRTQRSCQTAGARGRLLLMQGLRISRGLLMVCDPCLSLLRQDRLVDQTNTIMPEHAEQVFDEICPNCLDYNRPLVDDMLGSSE